MRRAEVSEENHNLLETVPNVEVLANLVDPYGNRLGNEIIRWAGKNPLKRKVIFICGEPGAGKSTLAEHAGRAIEQIYPHYGKPVQLKYDHALEEERKITYLANPPERERFNHRFASKILDNDAFVRIVENPSVGGEDVKVRGIWTTREVIEKLNPEETDVVIIMNAADPSMQIRTAAIREDIENTPAEQVVRMLREKYHIGMKIENSPKIGRILKRSSSLAAKRADMNKIASEINEQVRKWYNEGTNTINPKAEIVSRIVLPAGVGEQSLEEKQGINERQIGVNKEENKDRMRRKVAYLDYFMKEHLGLKDKPTFKSFVAINPMIEEINLIGL